MKKTERRNSVRKAIRISCVVQFPSGITINGNTKDLNLEGVLIESTPVSSNSKNSPAVGEIGLLSLKFDKDGVENSIRVPCQTRHLEANSIGLLIHFIKLNKNEQDLLRQVIDSDNADVD